MNMLDPKQIKGHFDWLTNEKQKIVMYIAAGYHYRDGVEFPDGSFGTVKMTYNQLKDLLSFMINGNIEDVLHGSLK